MSTVALTQDNFEQVVTGNEMVIIDFWAPWCGPCKAFAPTFDEASEKHADVVFAKVNTDEQQEIAQAFAIRSIPTLMLFRQNVVLFQEAGVLPASALDEVLGKARALDMEEVRRQIAEQEAGGEKQGSGQPES